MRGEDITHIAPTADMVPGLMNDLFKYLRSDSDLEIIKSCVFHYEMELYIHLRTETAEREDAGRHGADG